MLTEGEFEVVQQTHYPTICSLSKDDLASNRKLLREYRNKARDRARQQRREMRGKASRGKPRQPATTLARRRRRKSSPAP
jgi:hypothetical protein